MAGRHDQAARRRSQRSRREKGCWVYIPAEQLERANIDPNDDPPYFRTWNGARRSIIVNLYREA